MTAKVKTAMPVAETGYVTPFVDGWVHWDPYEKTQALQWPASVSVFMEMDNSDSRVGSLLEAISLPILETPWRIDPNGAPAEVVQFVARVLRLPVVGSDSIDDEGRSRGRFSWLEHLREVASPTPQFGHAIFEQVYRKEADGRYVLRKLGARPQWTIQRFNVAMDGGLDSVTQLAPASNGRVMYGPNPTDIPINRLVAYTRNKRPGFWQGRSILRASYKNWLLKDELLRIEVAVARRNGMGVPVGTASKPNDDKEVKAMQRIASGFRGGMQSGVGLALGQKLELLGVQGNLPDIRQAIVYHDKAIAMSGLLHFMNLDGGGSFAMAAVQEKPFIQAVNAAAKLYRDTAQAHIIEDLVDINFGTDVRCPRLVFDTIGTQQDATAQSLKLLVDAGLLAPDLRIERTLRQMLDLPAKPDDGDPDAEPPVEPAAPTGGPTPAADPGAPPVPPKPGARVRHQRAAQQAQGRLF